jgi:hypothetical protein
MMQLFISSDDTEEQWYSAEEQYAAEEGLNEDLYYEEEAPGSDSDLQQETYEDGPWWV